MSGKSSMDQGILKDASGQVSRFKILIWLGCGDIFLQKMFQRTFYQVSSKALINESRVNSHNMGNRDWLINNYSAKNYMVIVNVHNFHPIDFP